MSASRRPREQRQPRACFRRGGAPLDSMLAVVLWLRQPQPHQVAPGRDAAPSWVRATASNVSTNRVSTVSARSARSFSSSARLASRSARCAASSSSRSFSASCSSFARGFLSPLLAPCAGAGRRVVTGLPSRVVALGRLQRLPPRASGGRLQRPLRSGRVRLRAPTPARGFRLGTPELGLGRTEVPELGREFLRARPAGVGAAHQRRLSGAAYPSRGMPRRVGPAQRDAKRRRIAARRGGALFELAQTDGRRFDVGGWATCGSAARRGL